MSSYPYQDHYEYDQHYDYSPSYNGVNECTCETLDEFNLRVNNSYINRQFYYGAKQFVEACPVSGVAWKTYKENKKTPLNFNLQFQHPTRVLTAQPLKSRIPPKYSFKPCKEERAHCNCTILNSGNGCQLVELRDKSCSQSDLTSLEDGDAKTLVDDGIEVCCPDCSMECCDIYDQDSLTCDCKSAECECNLISAPPLCVKSNCPQLKSILKRTCEMNTNELEVPAKKDAPANLPETLNERSISFAQKDEEPCKELEVRTSSSVNVNVASRDSLEEEPRPRKIDVNINLKLVKKRKHKKRVSPDSSVKSSSTTSVRSSACKCCKCKDELAPSKDDTYEKPKQCDRKTCKISKPFIIFDKPPTKNMLSSIRQAIRSERKPQPESDDEKNSIGSFRKSKEKEIKPVEMEVIEFDSKDHNSGDDEYKTENSDIPKYKAKSFQPIGDVKMDYLYCMCPQTSKTSNKVKVCVPDSCSCHKSEVNMLVRRTSKPLICECKRPVTVQDNEIASYVFGQKNSKSKSNLLTSTKANKSRIDQLFAKLAKISKRNRELEKSFQSRTNKNLEKCMQCSIKGEHCKIKSNKATLAKLPKRPIRDSNLLKKLQQRDQKKTSKYIFKTVDPEDKNQVSPADYLLQRKLQEKMLESETLKREIKKLNERIKLAFSNVDSKEHCKAKEKCINNNKNSHYKESLISKPTASRNVASSKKLVSSLEKARSKIAEEISIKSERHKSSDMKVIYLESPQRSIVSRHFEPEPKQVNYMFVGNIFDVLSRVPKYIFQFASQEINCSIKMINPTNLVTVKLQEITKVIEKTFSNLGYNQYQEDYKMIENSKPKLNKRSRLSQKQIVTRTNKAMQTAVLNKFSEDENNFLEIVKKFERYRSVENYLQKVKSSKFKKRKRVPKIEVNCLEKILKVLFQKLKELFRHVIEEKEIRPQNEVCLIGEEQTSSHKGLANGVEVFGPLESAVTVFAITIYFLICWYYIFPK